MSQNLVRERLRRHRGKLVAGGVEDANILPKMRVLGRLAEVLGGVARTGAHEECNPQRLE